MLLLHVSAPTGHLQGDHVPRNKSVIDAIQDVYKCYQLQRYYIKLYVQYNAQIKRVVRF
jgi:hypothetical protein